VTRGLAVAFVLVAACGGGSDKNQQRDDGGTYRDAGMSDGGGGVNDASPIDPPACTIAAVTLGDGAAGACSFDINMSFDPARINIVLMTGTSREVLCHSLRETGCTGAGWHWNYSHQITLCSDSCNALMTGGSAVQVSLETGCLTSTCAQGSCTGNTGYCTHQTAYTCCSGRCDGDSCGSGLWGLCSGQFGCFEGQCQNGFCRCAPSELQCGASCVDPMTSLQNCGTCGNACSGGKTCQQGACVCPTGTSECNGTCVDLTSDMANCGICGRTCRVEQSCTSSQCLCPSGQNDCNGACVSITDPMNCGACNNVCDAASETCTPLINGSAYCACKAGLYDCFGTCVDRLTDENNCGTCGNVCPGNKQCVGGSC
jgi:hypothetical protein